MFKRLLRIGRKRNTKVINQGPKQITVCCDATIDVLKVGAEIYARCTKCGKYIGHLVGRPIGVLEAHYHQYILKACRERGVTLLPNAEELAGMYKSYCDYLDDFAMQAARMSLKDHIPIE